MNNQNKKGEERLGFIQVVIAVTFLINLAYAFLSQPFFTVHVPLMTSVMAGIIIVIYVGIMKEDVAEE